MIYSIIISSHKYKGNRFIEAIRIGIEKSSSLKASAATYSATTTATTTTSRLTAPIEASSHKASRLAAYIMCIYS